MKKLPLAGHRIDCPKCERGDMSLNLKYKSIDRYNGSEKIVAICSCCVQCGTKQKTNEK
jgi:hypothetical protein